MAKKEIAIYGFPRETRLWEGIFGGIVGLLLIILMILSVVALFFPDDQIKNIHLLKLVLGF